MSKETIAEKLNGSEYPLRTSLEIREECRRDGIVIVCGGSDDLMEFSGAIDEEISCYDGGTVYINKQGCVENKCEDDDCPYFKILMNNATKIEALWCDEPDIAWTYKTDIPHSTFLVHEDDEIYCRGIVFNLSDVK